MAHFYGSIQGNRGEATRMGTKTSGIEGHIRGWNIGCRVVIGHDDEGNDVVNVYLTSGSSGMRSSKHLGAYVEKDLER